MKPSASGGPPAAGTIAPKLVSVDTFKPAAVVKAFNA
jgi:hypothetical protein